MQELCWTLLDIPSYLSGTMSTSTAVMAPPVASEAAAEPEFASIPNARLLLGLSRSTLYELEAEREIRFIRVRKRGNMRGRVLVDLASVRKFLNSCAEGKLRNNGQHKGSE
jgi:hypothetical protein